MEALRALIMRDRILRGIREFFSSRGFIEVETPILLPHPSQEPYLEPLQTVVHDYCGRAYDGFLRMSPEFSLKKLVAAMCSTPPRSPSQEGGGEKNSFPTSRRERLSPFLKGGAGGGARADAQGERGGVGVFEMGPVFRDSEPWGETHNPEFTMLEWYRLGATYRDLMRDCEELFTHVFRRVIRHQRRGNSKLETRNSKQIRNPNDQKIFSPSTAVEGEREGVGQAQICYQGQAIDLTSPWERLTMRRAWERYAKLDLDRLLTKWSTPGVDHFRGARAAMAKACRAKGYTVSRDDTFDDLFFKIHLSEVEPKLGRTRPTFLTDWPASMAALARRRPRDPRYAERVELYIGGLEIANGFSELTDADEQLARFRQDQRLRKKLGKPVYSIDRDFIAALRRIPPTAGIALGVDRLVMLLLDAATIDEVRWLPATDLWK